MSLEVISNQNCGLQIFSTVIKQAEARPITLIKLVVGKREHRYSLRARWRGAASQECAREYASQGRKCAKSKEAVHIYIDTSISANCVRWSRCEDIDA